MKTFFTGYFLGIFTAVLLWVFRNVIAKRAQDEAAKLESKLNPK